MTMNKALHPRDDADRQYVSIKEEGRGFARIQESVDASMRKLEEYFDKCQGRLIIATRNNTDNTSINRIKSTRKQKWEEKQISGHFK